MLLRGDRPGSVQTALRQAWSPVGNVLLRGDRPGSVQTALSQAWSPVGNMLLRGDRPGSVHTALRQAWSPIGNMFKLKFNFIFAKCITDCLFPFLDFSLICILCNSPYFCLLQIYF